MKVFNLLLNHRIYLESCDIGKYFPSMCISECLVSAFASFLTELLTWVKIISDVSAMIHHLKQWMVLSNDGVFAAQKSFSFMWSHLLLVGLYVCVTRKCLSYSESILLRQWVKDYSIHSSLSDSRYQDLYGDN